MIPNLKRIRWIAVLLAAIVLSSCDTDNNNKARTFCSDIQIGQNINDVIAKSEAMGLSKIWIARIAEDGQLNERYGSISLRDIARNTEKFQKTGHPNTWARGKFSAMDQILGYLRYVCEIDFENATVTGKNVYKRE